jgi:hypothetical protein
MPIISDFTTIFCRDGSSESLRSDLARNRLHFEPHEWSMVPWPPLNWEREIPRYKATIDLIPSPNPRHRFEKPFSTVMDSHVWTQASAPVAAGTEITSTCWPHPSMQGLNYSGQQVLAYFKASIKSRLPVSPWNQGRVRLQDGISGPLPGHVSTPHVKPMNLRPVA